MATAAAATPAARAGESSAQATATTSAATAKPVYRVLGGSTASRATGAATGRCCLRGGVGGGRLGLVWVSLHGERQNISRFEFFSVATSLSTSYASSELVRSKEAANASGTKELACGELFMRTASKQLDSGRWQRFTALLVIGALRGTAALEQRP